MLIRKNVPKKDINLYKKFISKKEYKSTILLSENIKGKRVLHINSTPEGGGVAEILNGLIPLELSLGIDARWYYINASSKLFCITKKIHDSLQGSRDKLSKKEKEYFLKANKSIERDIKRLRPDVLVIHDPQPMAAINCCENIPSVLRIHIDLSKPNPDTLKFFMPYIRRFDAVIYSMNEYIPSSLRKAKNYIVRPAIDPLSKKHVPISRTKAGKVLKKMGIDIKRPLITQVSRFDIWKDPLGVISAYKKVKKVIPEVQLALIGILEAKDDPTAQKVFNDIKKIASRDKDIHIYIKLDKYNISNNLAVNVFQRASDVVLQKSIREGFGLTVTEAMWKEQVLIGGNVGGIKKQILNGKNGYLVNTPTEASKRILEVLGNKQKARHIGRVAKESVRKNYLLPRLLKDHLIIYNRVIRS